MSEQEDAADELMVTAITLERAMCTTLGKQWSPAGMSVETLVHETCTALTASLSREAALVARIAELEAMQKSMHTAALAALKSPTTASTKRRHAG